MKRVTGPLCAGTVPSRTLIEYESRPSLSIRVRDDDNGIGGRVTTGLDERQHGVGRIGLEAVVALVPQVDEVSCRHASDDPLGPVGEVERRRRDVLQRDAVVPPSLVMPLAASWTTTLSSARSRAGQSVVDRL